MNQTQLEEQTVEAFRARRKDPNIEIEMLDDGIWKRVNFAKVFILEMNYRIKPIPKTEKAQEWNAYLDKDGKLLSHDEYKESSSWIRSVRDPKPIRVREVIDTPKEPKERREWKAWVRDEDGSMIEESDWNYVMPRDVEPHECGWRLTTLVEKGGGE